MKRCDYCAKKISYSEMYCSTDCEKKALFSQNRTKRKRKVFSIFNFIGILAIMAGLFITMFNIPIGLWVAGVGSVELGILFIILPFPTEGMIQKHKIRKAEQLSRGLGIALLIIGIISIIAGFIYM